MKKKTKRLFFLAGAAGCTMAAAIWLLPGTSAYFTDHENVWNRMVFGHNTSTIDEEFPTPTPVPPGKSVVKRVKSEMKAPLPAIFVRHLYSVNQLKRLRDLIRKTG